MDISPKHSASDSINSDPGSLNRLRVNAARDPRAAIHEAAKQFESVFMTTLLKEMHNSVHGSGAFDNEGTKTMTAMLDQQYAQIMSQKGIGLAQMIETNLAQNMTASGARK